jgi:chromosome segregation ATPase
MNEQHPSPEQALEIVADALRGTGERVAALEQQLEERAQSAEASRHRFEAELDAAHRRVGEVEAELEETRTQLRRADEQVAGKQHECRQLEERLALDSERMQDLRDAVAHLQVRDKWARRRRGLVRRLIAELRQRQRANLALKTGLDALRQFKNKAEEDRRALLEKYRRLQASVHHDDDAAVEADSRGADTHRVVEREDLSHSGMHRRLQAQSELIESMERDIQRVGALKRELGERERRIAELEKELALKQTVIGTLEADIESTMRNRRLDLRKPTPPPPEARPGKEDTGTVRLRALPPERLPETGDEAAAADRGSTAVHALLRRGGD